VVDYLAISSLYEFIIKFGSERIFKSSTWQHTHTQPFYGSLDFVRDNPGEPVPEETFTHSHHRGHQLSLSASSM